MIDLALRDRLDRYEDALQSIVQWSEAYPLDIFPEPDWKAARKLLEAGGISLDSISAHCMRRVVEGVGKIAREAAYSLAVLLLSGRADGTARVARSRGVYAAAQNRSYVRLRLCVTTRSLLG